MTELKVKNKNLPYRLIACILGRVVKSKNSSGPFRINEKCECVGTDFVMELRTNGGKLGDVFCIKSGKYSTAFYFEPSVNFNKVVLRGLNNLEGEVVTAPSCKGKQDKRRVISRPCYKGIESLSIKRGRFCREELSSPKNIEYFF